MQYSHTCPTCKHREAAYAHRLNKGMVETLKKIVNAYTNKPVKLKDLNLTHNQFANAQKLQYLGLVMRGEAGYVPTTKAYSFVMGQLAVCDVAVTLNGRVLDESHPAWYGVKKRYKKITDYFSITYDKKEHYGSQDTRQDTEHLRQGRLHFAH